jgi:hypothetical protein
MQQKYGHRSKLTKLQLHMGGGGGGGEDDSLQKKGTKVTHEVTVY